MNLSPLAQALYEQYNGNFDDWLIVGDDEVANIQWIDNPSGVIPDLIKLEARRDELRSQKIPNRIRKQRDKMLYATDWVVVKHKELGVDVPQKWLSYRQALRDITEQSGFPDNFKWPSKPE